MGGVELQAAKRREKEEDERRLRWGGAVAPDETLLFRESALCGQSQAQMIRAMEQTRVIGEELLQAKADVARLHAEANMSAEAYRSKEVLLQSIIRSKGEILVMKNELLHSKKSAPKAHDALAADAPKKVCDGSLFPIERAGDWYSVNRTQKRFCFQKGIPQRTPKIFEK